MFDVFPHFDMGEYTLRKLRPYEDAHSLLEYITDPRVCAFIAAPCVPHTYDEATADLQYWASRFTYKSSYYWAIARKEDDKLIGTVGYNYVNQTHMRAELSYDLAPAYWGKGVMYNSLLQIMRYSFEELKIRRIQATVSQSNMRCINLLERLQMKREGTLAKYECLLGVFHDFYMYAATR